MINVDTLFPIIDLLYIKFNVSHSEDRDGTISGEFS